MRSVDRLRPVRGGWPSGGFAVRRPGGLPMLRGLPVSTRCPGGVSRVPVKVPVNGGKARKMSRKFSAFFFQFGRIGGIMRSKADRMSGGQGSDRRWAEDMERETGDPGSARYVLMIVLQSVLYGLMDVLSKQAYAVMPVYCFLLLRYLLAALLMLPLRHRRIWSAIRRVPVGKYILPSACMALAFLFSNLA